MTTHPRFPKTAYERLQRVAELLPERTVTSALLEAYGDIPEYADALSVFAADLKNLLSVDNVR